MFSPLALFDFFLVFPDSHLRDLLGVSNLCIHSYEYLFSDHHDMNCIQIIERCTK